MRRSFFSRIARHQPALFLDQHENRLTEITAALLEQSRPFLNRFVNYLLEDGGNSEAFRAPFAEADLTLLQEAFTRTSGTAAKVETQLPTLGGRFVDLAIEMGEPASGLTIWIEVKDGSDLHGDQLDAYVREIHLRAAGRASCVVLLVPSGWEPRTSSEIPSAILVADWQGVARVAEDLAADDDDLGWLLAEYVSYLKEENLSEPDHKPLDEFSARALMEAESIEDTELALCEQAASSLVQTWGPVRIDSDSKKKNRSREGEDFWIQFAPTPRGQAADSRWGEAWFELAFPASMEMDRPELCRAESAFIAGATFYTKKEAMSVASAESWMAERAAEGFVFFRLAGDYRVAKLSYPDELVSEKTLDAQAKKLSSWAIDAFAVLAKNPPLIVNGS